jgi:hypothetical protein
VLGCYIYIGEPKCFGFRTPDPFPRPKVHIRVTHPLTD